MIRDQIETMLGIRGKTLPSAADFVDLANATGDIELAWHQLEATEEQRSQQHHGGSGGSSSQSLSGQDHHHQQQQNGAAATNAFLYSDYTKKLQSVFPACKYSVVL